MRKTRINIKSSLVAPCGMNCALCLAYQRTKNRCHGCISAELPKMNYCARCLIKNCGLLRKGNSKYCFNCSEYPCSRIKHIDKRYRTKYGMSMIENLDTIKKIGIQKFLKLEKEKWKCPKCGNIFCVHRENCLVCGAGRIFY